MKAIKLAKDCMAIGRMLGHPMEILDLGGGFPQGTIPDHLKQILLYTQNQPYRIIAEPGRHFSANTCQLVVRVMGKRLKHGKISYHLNDSLYHSFNVVLMDSVDFSGKNMLLSSWNNLGEELEIN